MVEADPFTYQTADPDIFVGGDCYRGASFCINAIADGHQAAISLHRFVQPGQLLDAGRDRRDYKQLDVENVDFGGFDKAPRQFAEEKCPLNIHSYEDNRGILTEEQIKKEGARCLSCGRAYVDPNMCVGCGQCVLQCEFDAAHLVKKTSIYADNYDKILPKAVGHTLKRGIKISLNALIKD
jgi:ferredoxin